MRADHFNALAFHSSNIELHPGRKTHHCVFAQARVWFTAGLNPFESSTRLLAVNQRDSGKFLPRDNDADDISQTP